MAITVVTAAGLLEGCDEVLVTTTMSHTHEPTSISKRCAVRTKPLARRTLRVQRARSAG